MIFIFFALIKMLHVETIVHYNRAINKNHVKRIFSSVKNILVNTLLMFWKHFATPIEPFCDPPGGRDPQFEWPYFRAQFFRNFFFFKKTAIIHLLYICVLKSPKTLRNLRLINKERSYLNRNAR